MKIIFILFLFFQLTYVHSQDIIVKINGDLIESKVEEVSSKFIKYYKYNNLKGSVFNIKIMDVAEIRYEDGSVKVYTTIKDNSESLEETKNVLTEYINQHAYWENSNEKKRYKIVFEEDYIRLIVMNVSGKKGDKGILYDFSKVYRFGQFDKREDEVVFLNIWVSILENKKKDIWEKHKLVMRVKGYENAKVIYKNLKQYNKLVLDKERSEKRLLKKE